MDEIYDQPIASFARCASDDCENRVQFLRLRGRTAVFLCGDHDQEPTA